jgi:Family of unknown function (DUF5996)
MRATSADVWPAIPLAEWAETRDTLHLWTQIVGKVRLVQTPWINHAWHCTLYVTARGLTTSPIPHGQRVFQIDFDFIEDELAVTTAAGERKAIGLEPRSVATFYRELMDILEALKLPVKIHPHASEIPETIDLSEDRRHRTYVPEHATRFWLALISSQRVFQRFRSRFIGKCSPIHFFWGGFDLAVTRFSGRGAPEHPAGIPHMPDWVAREAYTHEVSSAGFWPGNAGGPVADAAFYSYAYPEPEGFAQANVRPAAAFYSNDLKEWILPYDALRKSDEPDRDLLDFLQDTYDAAANLAGWDRQALERTEQLPPRLDEAKRVR